MTQNASRLLHFPTVNHYHFSRHLQFQNFADNFSFIFVFLIIHVSDTNRMYGPRRRYNEMKKVAEDVSH